MVCVLFTAVDLVALSQVEWKYDSRHVCEVVENLFGAAATDVIIYYIELKGVLLE